MSSITRSILIFDDEEMIRLILADFFTDNGFSVFTASEEVAAAEIVRENRPQFATVDISIPGTDSIAFILRSLELNPDMKIVIFTGHGDICLDPRLIAAGFSERNIVFKPARRIGDIMDRLLEL